MKRIFLIGYMGAGKTTVGRLLAEKLQLSFIDLDIFIEKRYNKTVREIFIEKGEEKFREIETKALQEISDFEDVVISTGGGAPCFNDNILKMNQSGITIYLKVSPVELTKRLDSCKHSRPIIKDKSTEELECFIVENLEKRDFFYNQAKIIFDAEEIDANVEQSVEELKKLFC